MPHPRDNRRRKARAHRRLARWKARRCRSIAYGELLADPVLFAKYMMPEHWPTPPWIERFIEAAVAYTPPPPDLDLPRMLKPSFFGARALPDAIGILPILEAPPGRVYALPDTPEAPPVVIHDIEITTEPEDTDR